MRELIHWAISVKKYSIVLKICAMLINLNLDNIDNYLKILPLLNDNGECHIAMEICKVVLRFLPKSPEMWNMVGYTFTSMEKYEKAISAYDLLWN